MSDFRRQLRFWSIWTLATAFVLMANPWGEFAAVEMLALLGPLLLVIPNRVWREASLALGLPLLTLAWLADPADSGVSRLLVAWAVFSGGIILAARVLERQRDLEVLVGRVTFDDHRDKADPGHDRNATKEGAKGLRQAVDRELGRARRHDRCFAVLSAACPLRSTEADSADLHRNALLRSLAENRARLELLGFLRGELHLYCDVVIDGSRVLALVPEIEGDDLERLLARLENSASETLDFGLEIGAASFPIDAICTEELIEAADRARTSSKLRSLPEQFAVDSSVDEPVLRSPDVRG